jgi:DNA-binding CsgD family transcriptional regulator
MTFLCLPENDANQLTYRSEIQLKTDLKQWWEKIATGVSSADDERSLRNKIVELLKLIDFEFFSFVFRQSIPDRKVQIRVLNNYPVQWQERYQEKEYGKIDPVLKLAARPRTLVTWSDNLFARSAALWEEAKLAGLSVGLSQSGWSRGGAYTVLSLARGGSLLDSGAVSNLEPYVLLLSDVVTSRAQEIIDNLEPRTNRIPLTQREIEVLRWSANGKKAVELAGILGVAESTINFHLHNARRKLGFKTKLQAAAYASKLGLLD